MTTLCTVNFLFRFCFPDRLSNHINKKNFALDVCSSRHSVILTHCSFLSCPSLQVHTLGGVVYSLYLWRELSNFPETLRSIDSLTRPFTRHPDVYCSVFWTRFVFGFDSRRQKRASASSSVFIIKKPYKTFIFPQDIANTTSPACPFTCMRDIQ